MPSVYKTNDGENIFDVVLSTYANLELTYKLMSENPLLENIDIELTSLPGISFTFDETFEQPEVQGERQIQLPPDKTEYQVVEGQNIFDLALMLYGEVEKSILILQDNEALLTNLNQRTWPGMVVHFNPELNENRVFTNYISTNSLVISTSDPSDNNGSGFTEGYEYDAFY